MLQSPLTIFALVISPIVTIIFAVLYRFRRDPVTQPPLIAAISFGLSSIALLLAQSGVILLAAFQQIATSKTSGIGAVVSGLLAAQQPLAWGFVDFAVCLLILLLISAVHRYSSETETPLLHAYVPLPALIITAVVLAGLFLMVYVQYGTVDLVMMICDKHRLQELAAQYDTTNPAWFAARISTRLVSITVLSMLQFVVLILIGFLNVFWRQKQEPHPRFATVLTLGALLTSAVSALSQFSFVDYLQRLGH